jgi:hypothetical protein
MRAWLVSIVLVGVLGGAVAGCHHDATAMCPQLDCKVSCPGGTRKDDNSGCPSCVCNGLPAPDGGADCPAVACTESCGLGFAVDATTGCPTCRCCFPADCQPGGCHGTGADGCPTCGPC